MTANAMASDREHCLAAGMNDYVAKPIDIAGLFETLGKWIEVPEQRRTAAAREDNATDTTSSVQLPDTLNGIDMQDGLTRVGGNRKLYHGILCRFRDSQADTPAQIAQALADRDNSTAERLAHTLKGVAGNIGAQRLQEAAHRLEQAIAAGQENVDAGLGALRNELTPVLSALDVLDDTPATQPAAAGPLDSDELAALLQNLRQLLEENDADATDMLDELAVLLAGSPLESELKPLRIAVSEYDFEAALGCLAELEQHVSQASHG